MRGRYVALAALAAAAAYLCCWPVPIAPVAWSPPANAGYTGAHAPNDRLSRMTQIDLGGEVGPEHVAVGPDGKLYVTVASGKVLRMNPDGSGRETFAQTGGRVLGFDFDAAGNFIAADAFKGLLSISPAGQVTMIADHVRAGDPIAYADAVVVAKSGRIYLSDASMRFAPPAWGGTFPASFLDILEQSATGRILEVDPATRAVRVIARGLSFANGIALSADESALLVNETGRYRVWRIAVSANDLDLAGGAPGDARARAARQSARLSGQPHARARRPHLAGLCQAARRGHRQAGGVAGAAQAGAAAAEGRLAGAQGVRPRHRLR